jgi:hypothetical protein
MSRKILSTRSMTALALVFAGAASVAHADDGSLGPLSDDIYAYLEPSRPVVSNPPPAFRKTHPSGLSEREYQELSSEGAVWHRAPVTDTTPSTFRQSHPNGLSDREYQALSSNSSMWQSTNPASVGSASGRR